MPGRKQVIRYRTDGQDEGKTFLKTVVVNNAEKKNSRACFSSKKHSKAKCPGENKIIGYRTGGQDKGEEVEKINGPSFCEKLMKGRKSGRFSDVPVARIQCYSCPR
ncbi:hypothetical protein CEXT_802001 [Caerostris extrusa]|uniref:Uncharacterized protein n=1 Tax=Caerostris extrusa TaxID=172846 RepID=A0AAV4UNM5_CAEEX|nr:hypothetical protein CEXT_802001 [Caerostris extrusa]